MGNAAASAAGANVIKAAEVTKGAVTLDASPPSPPPLPPSPPTSLGFLNDIGGTAITSDSGGVEDWDDMFRHMGGPLPSQAMGSWYDMAEKWHMRKR